MTTATEFGALFSDAIAISENLWELSGTLQGRDSTPLKPSAWTKPRLQVGRVTLKRSP